MIWDIFHKVLSKISQYVLQSKINVFTLLETSLFRGRSIQTSTQSSDIYDIPEQQSSQTM